MLCQIGSELRHQLRVVVIALAEHDPAHMRPEKALARRMRVALLIGFLMVNTMHGHPENRPAFESQRTANSKEVFQPQWAFVPPVRMQTVVSMLIPRPVQTQ